MITFKDLRIQKHEDNYSKDDSNVYECSIEVCGSFESVFEFVEKLKQIEIFNIKKK